MVQKTEQKTIGVVKYIEDNGEQCHGFYGYKSVHAFWPSSVNGSTGPSISFILGLGHFFHISISYEIVSMYLSLQVWSSS